MKIKSLFSALLTAVIAASSLTVFGTGVAADIDDHWDAPLSIPASELPEGNLLPRSDFDADNCVSNDWNQQGQRLLHYTDANGGYLETRDMKYVYTGFLYYPVFDIEPGTYKFTGYFRTADYGEISRIRVHFIQYDGNNAGEADIYITNEWIKVEYYVTFTDYLKYIKVSNAGYVEYLQSYCMDNFSLVKADEIPEDMPAYFGTKNTPEEAWASQYKRLEHTPYDPEAEKKYEVKGIIMNHDGNSFQSSVAQIDNYTYEDVVETVKQFEGTHVTDYFINVNGNTAVFPSPSWTDYFDLYDRYYGTEEWDNMLDANASAGTLLGANYLYNELYADYIGIWHEVLRDVGINPWLSFRMNDVHHMESVVQNPGKLSFNLSDFFYNHPEYRRVQHHSYAGYMDYAADYTYPEVRQHYLNLFNDALNRYDTYGIELDFQREMYLFHIGGEYNGLSILNQFMRDIDDLVAIYEEKYGHEIKIAVRVGSDPLTCADFGLDVPTWAAEGIVDMVIPASRWESSDNDIPIQLWCSILHPYGVEVVLSIETAHNHTWPGSGDGGHTIETIAGLASSAFSQGADKVYLYNYYWSPVSQPYFKDVEKITTDETYWTLNSGEGYWNLVTSVGSPDKLLTMDRKCTVSYNDTRAPWRKNTNQVVPATIPADGTAHTFRIPVGDIADGSKLYVKFSTNDASIVENPPLVYVNSKPCTYKWLVYSDQPFTTRRVLTYEIPETAYDYTYMVIEIMATDNKSFETDYVEIYVDAK